MARDTIQQSATPERANPKAEQAFLDYVAMGPGRSLEALRDRYQSETEPSPTKRLATLKDWSARYHWQARIATSVAARTEVLIEQAAEFDAYTFAQTSRKLHESIAKATDVQEIIRIRESVRKPMPRGGADISVAVNVDIRQLAERIAREEGMDVADLMADAEQIAATAWGND